MELQLIQNKIHEIRGRRVMLDFDLAALYGVETKNLNLSVKRNLKRFPDDFMFRLSEQEWEFLRLQIETSNRGGRRYMPYAFTEQGVAMLSGLLNSDVAIEINIGIMRAFVALRQFRQLALENAEIKAKLAMLERGGEETLAALNDLSEDIRKEIEILYTAIEEMATRPTTEEKPRRRIGYRRAGEE